MGVRVGSPARSPNISGAISASKRVVEATSSGPDHTAGPVYSSESDPVRSMKLSCTFASCTFAEAIATLRGELASPG